VSLYTDAPRPTGEGFDAGGGGSAAAAGDGGLLGLAEKYAGSGAQIGNGIAFGMGGVDLPQGTNLSEDPAVLLGGDPDPAWHAPFLPGVVPKTEGWHPPMLAPDDDPAGPWSD